VGYEILADTALRYAHQYGTLRGNAYVALRWLRQGRIEEAAHLLDLNALLRPSTGQIGAID